MNRNQLNRLLSKLAYKAERLAGQYLASFELEEEHALKNNYTSSFSKEDFKKACHYARLSNRICQWLIED